LPDLTELVLPSLSLCCVVGLRRGFWTRHRRKILVSLRVAGVGYTAYRLYDVRQSQLVRVKKLRSREEDEEAADKLFMNQ
jgi:peroxin-3